MNNLTYWKNGLKDGIPIALGYFAVSFSFGILAGNYGLSPFQAVFMSATNYTSAGQFAALGLIANSAGYIEMAVAQSIINLRYFLMSCSLSQKIDTDKAFFHRFLLAAGITDEIFAVSVCKKGRLHPFYNYGLMNMAMPGWALGTLAGIVSGSILPERIVSALSIALYAMFIAVIIPPAKGDRILAGIILLSILVSLLFAYIPVINKISLGFKIIILTILIAGGAAFLFPVSGDRDEE
ncbi:MAG: AzlC family ABC transporter permease [Halanaerobiaceae bacterium]|nr:AzlC family ABC transporter permease [Halanaerobiaceae bacterium]